MEVYSTFFWCLDLGTTSNYYTGAYSPQCGNSCCANRDPNAYTQSVPPKQMRSFQKFDTDFRSPACGREPWGCPSCMQPRRAKSFISYSTSHFRQISKCNNPSLFRIVLTCLEFLNSKIYGFYGYWLAYCRYIHANTQVFCFLSFGMYILAQKWHSAFSADTELKFLVPILTRLTTETGLL